MITVEEADLCQKTWVDLHAIAVDLRKDLAVHLAEVEVLAAENRYLKLRLGDLPPEPCKACLSYEARISALKQSYVTLLQERDGIRQERDTLQDDLRAALEQKRVCDELLNLRKMKIKEKNTKLWERAEQIHQLQIALQRATEPRVEETKAVDPANIRRTFEEQYDAEIVDCIEKALQNTLNSGGSLDLDYGKTADSPSVLPQVEVFKAFDPVAEEQAAETKAEILREMEFGEPDTEDYDAESMADFEEALDHANFQDQREAPATEHTSYASKLADVIDAQILDYQSKQEPQRVKGQALPGEPGYEVQQEMQRAVAEGAELFEVRPPEPKPQYDEYKPTSPVHAGLFTLAEQSTFFEQFPTHCNVNSFDYVPAGLSHDEAVYYQRFKTGLTKEQCQQLYEHGGMPALHDVVLAATRKMFGSPLCEVAVTTGEAFDTSGISDLLTGLHRDSTVQEPVTGESSLPVYVPGQALPDNPSYALQQEMQKWVDYSPQEFITALHSQPDPSAICLDSFISAEHLVPVTADATMPPLLRTGTNGGFTKQSEASKYIMACFGIAPIMTPGNHYKPWLDAVPTQDAVAIAIKYNGNVVLRDVILHAMKPTLWTRFMRLLWGKSYKVRVNHARLGKELDRVLPERVARRKRRKFFSFLTTSD